MHRLFSAAPTGATGVSLRSRAAATAVALLLALQPLGPGRGPTDPGAAAARPRRRVRRPGSRRRRNASSASRWSAQIRASGGVPRRPRGQRLPQRARQPARVRRRRPVRLRVLRRPRPQHQRLRPARRLRRRQHRPHPARAVRVGTRIGAGARNHARHAAALHALARRPAALAAVLAGRTGRRDRGVALGIVVGRPGDVRGRRFGAGAGDPDAAQLHARARVRGRPHRLPAAGRRRASIRPAWRRSWIGCRSPTVSPTATRRPTCGRTRSPTSASPRRRRARTASRYRQVGDSLDFHLVRALLRSYTGTDREAVAVLRRGAGRAQVQQRGRRPATASSPRCCAPRTSPRAKQELATLEKMAPPHPMIDAMAGHVLMESGDLPAAIARFEEALAKYPNKMQLVYDYPDALLEGRSRRRRGRVRRGRSSRGSRATARCTGSPRRSTRDAGQDDAAAPAPGRVLRLAGDLRARGRCSSNSPPRPATATSTSTRWSRPGCARCAGNSPSNRPRWRRTADLRRGAPPRLLPATTSPVRR